MRQSTQNTKSCQSALSSCLCHLFLILFQSFFNVFFFSLALCSFSSSSRAEGEGKRYAVLIGISRYKHINSLRWPAKDVERVRLFLKKRGFQDVNMKVLRDEKATKEAILAALQWLQKTAGPKDDAFFYFSGHGSQIPDLDGDEDDGKDETLCPYDTNEQPESHISDDWIEPWLKSFRARELTVLLDSCFSGGALSSKSVLPVGSLSRHWENPYTKRFFETPQGRLILERARQKAASVTTKGRGQESDSSRAIRVTRRTKPTQKAFGSLTLLTAAQGDQLAWENTAVAGGIFTVMLLRALDEDPCIHDFKSLQASIDRVFQQEPFVRYRKIQQPTYTQSSTLYTFLLSKLQRHPNHLRVCDKNNRCATLWVNQDGQASTRNYCLVAEKLMYVFVRPDAPMRVRLEVRSTEGTTGQLFPNPMQKDFSLSAQKSHRFPPEPPTYRFRAKGPKGWMTVILNVAFSDLETKSTIQIEVGEVTHFPLKGELRLYVP